MGCGEFVEVWKVGWEKGCMESRWRMQFVIGPEGGRGLLAMF